MADDSVVQRLNITLPIWMIKEMLGSSKNKSGRIRELLNRGYIAEMRSRSGADKALNVDLARNLLFFDEMGQKSLINT